MAEAPVITTLASLQNDPTATSVINNNFANIQTVFTDVLSRSGVLPNQMLSALDMNSNRIINLPAPSALTDPVRLQDVTTPTQISILQVASNVNPNTVYAGPASGGIGFPSFRSIVVADLPSPYNTSNPPLLPVGGTTGQILRKNSNTNYDASWSSTLPSNAVINGTLTINGGPLTVFGAQQNVTSTLVNSRTGFPNVLVGQETIVTYNGVDADVRGGFVQLIYQPTSSGTRGSDAFFADGWYDSTFTENGTFSTGKFNNYVMAQITAVVALGGSNNVVGDVLTIVGGTCNTQLNTPPQFTVTAVSGGAVTAVTFNRNLGACTVYPSNPVSTTSSNGSAAPPTLNLTIATAPSLANQVALEARVRNQSKGTVTWGKGLQIDGAQNSATGAYTNVADVYLTAPPYGGYTNSYGIFFADPFASGSLAAATNAHMTFQVSGTGEFYFGTNVGTPPTGTLATFSTNTGNVPTLPVNGNSALLVSADGIPTRLALVAAPGNSAAPVINGWGSRGTVAVPTATQSGDGLLTVVGEGYSGSAFFTTAGAGFTIAATENFNAGAAGSNLTIFGTPNGTTTKVSVASFQAGVQIDTPTGGDKGSGTINISGDYYKNNAIIAETATSPITLSGAGAVGCATCVTSAASLTANQLVIGSGSQGEQSLGTLGTTTTVLHGNAAGAPTFGSVSLTADISGVLPIANGGTNCSSASGTCLDNITGFGSTGLLARTAAGTYVFRTATGTTNRLTVTNGDGVAGNPTFDISTSYVGQATITTLGTIATGVWNGTVVGATYGGTGVNNGSFTITLAGTLSLPVVIQGDIWYGSAANTISTLAKNTSATRYLSNTGTSNNPAWAQIDLTNGVTGALPGANGGTGLSTAAIGDIIYASATTPTWARLADVATGALLASGGVSTAPSYCTACILTTSLTVPTDYGGTGAASTKTIASTSGAGTSDKIIFQTGSQAQAGFIDTSQRWFIGTNTATTPFANLLSGTILAIANADNSLTRFAMVAASTTGGLAIFNQYVSRGTVASPSATQSGDSVFAFGGTPYGTSYQTNGGVLIVGAATENLDGTHGGTNMQIKATPNGSVSSQVEVYVQSGMTLGATQLTTIRGGLGLNTITASASAPGAAGAKIEARCGTNAGTIKLVAYAGTSSTGVTIIDNIGASVTGC